MPHPASNAVRTLLTAKECARESGQSLDVVEEFIRGARPYLFRGKVIESHGYHDGVAVIDGTVYVVAQVFAEYCVYGPKSDWQT